MESWTLGNNGIVLFQSANDRAILGFNKGKVWSFSISLQDLQNIPTSSSSLPSHSLEVFDSNCTSKFYKHLYI